VSYSHCTNVTRDYRRESAAAMNDTMWDNHSRQFDDNTPIIFIFIHPNGRNNAAVQ